MSVIYPPIDPDETDFRIMVWCSLDGTNDGTSADTGELQGATISGHTATAVGSSITVDSSNLNSVTWRGVTYSANTIVTVFLSGGTAGTDGQVLVTATLSDGRVLQQTMVVPCGEDTSYGS